ncbi:hypothetical protein BDR03DRAFT_979958 [Suillus americanus]|nr:hypothetical protein BDR03DRAFT_979958 [Suillus americanus]
MASGPFAPILCLAIQIWPTSMQDFELQTNLNCCVWLESGETVLINYIIANKSKGGDGFNFDKTSWNDAHMEMVKQPVLQDCRSMSIKWVRICKVYQVIHKIANTSGISYGAELGANIGCESETIWADYVVMHDMEIIHGHIQ